MDIIKPYIYKYGKLFSLAIFFLTLEALCDLALPTLMANFLDYGVIQKDIHYVIYMGGIMLLIVAIGAFFAMGRNIISGYVSQSFGADLRGDLYKKIHSVALTDLKEVEQASMITRLTNDVTQVQNTVNSLMRIAVKAPLVGIGSVIMGAMLNIQMSLVFVILIPLVLFLILLNMKVGYPIFYRVQQGLDKVNHRIREYLSGVRVVKAFHRFEYETQKFSEVNEAYQKISISANSIMAIFSPSISLIVNLGIAAIIYMGAQLVENKTMQVGQIVAFTNYMTQLLFAFTAISFVFNSFVRAKASVQRIGEILAIENSMVINDGGIKLSSDVGGLEFREVDFSYGNTKSAKVLRNISFTCNSGEMIGIIGATGSGKSSLVHLVPRLFEVDDGQILLEGKDITTINLQDLREKIGVVPQMSMLFSGTLFENIAWGKEMATLEEIREVSKIAEIHHFIEGTPEKYDTLIGQGGVNLSGGQKQRVSIARALLRRPSILILDDSTSALDMQTEKQVLNNIRERFQETTLLLVAQRISSVQQCDKILVLDNGKLVAQGSHAELLETCEVYQEISSSQLQKGAVI